VRPCRARMRRRLLVCCCIMTWLQWVPAVMRSVKVLPSLMC
jgi:hypothetical protein